MKASKAIGWSLTIICGILFVFFLTARHSRVEELEQREALGAALRSARGWGMGGQSHGLGIDELDNVHLHFPKGGLPTNRGILPKQKSVMVGVQLEPSEDNWLLVNASALGVHEARSSFKEKMLSLGYSLNGGVLEDAIDLWAEYLPQIGANGILDVMQSAAKDNLDLTWVHEIGVFLADQIESEDDLQFLIEAVGRKSLRMAPLHGAAWRALERFADMDSSRDIFRIVDEKLCFFRDVEDMMDLYMSCVHGIGHGLSMLYGVDRVQEAALICGESDDHDFQYACATGVFMSILEPVMEGMAPPVPVSSWAPCDTVAFPAACFRFRTGSFKRAFRASVDFCDSMSDTYHSLGCIWGMAYVTHELGTTIDDAYDMCSPYHPNSHAKRNNEDMNDPAIAELNLDRYLTCVDGFFASNKISRATEERAAAVCASFQVKEARELCEKLAAREENNLMDEQEEFRWNYGLLEKYAPEDRSLPVPPATFPKIRNQRQSNGSPVRDNYGTTPVGETWPGGEWLGSPFQGASAYPGRGTGSNRRQNVNYGQPNAHQQPMEGHH